MPTPPSNRTIVIGLFVMLVVAVTTVNVVQSNSATGGRRFLAAGESSCSAPGGGTCGDGVVDAGEGCDDNNTTAGDGCSATCTVESGYSCTGAPSTCTTTCGDSIVAGSEACDGGTCCLASCAFKASGAECRAAAAGGCDVAENCTGSSADCPADTFLTSATTCRTSTSNCDPAETCSLGTAACPSDTNNCTAGICGDGTVNTGEQCDDGNNSNTDACLNGCTNAICGDGYVHFGTETCDDGNASDADLCNTSCSETYCGDGIVQAVRGEACDGDADCTGTCTTSTKGGGGAGGGTPDGGTADGGTPGGDDSVSSSYVFVDFSDEGGTESSDASQWCLDENGSWILCESDQTSTSSGGCTYDYSQNQWVNCAVTSSEAASSESSAWYCCHPLHTPENCTPTTRPAINPDIQCPDQLMIFQDYPACKATCPQGTSSSSSEPKKGNCCTIRSELIAANVKAGQCFSELTSLGKKGYWGKDLTCFEVKYCSVHHPDDEDNDCYYGFKAGGSCGSQGSGGSGGQSGGSGTGGEGSVQFTVTTEEPTNIPRCAAGSLTP